MTAPLPILYSFRRCPYAMRARMAIAASGQPCALREVVLRNKPAEMLEASPKGTVPVLVLPDGRVLEESLDVMRWALSKSDPQGWFALPDAQQEEAEALIAENDGPFKTNLDRYKYAARYQGADPIEHRTAGLGFLQKLDNRLEGRRYLFGDVFTYADAAIAPFTRQFVRTDPDWFASTDLENLSSWLTRILDSSHFTTVMKKYPAWTSGDTEPVFGAET